MKLVIPKADLPPIDGTEGGYFLRYRLTTDDRNKFSAWSPVYEVGVTYDYTDVNGAVNVSGGIVSVAWGLVTGFNSYDIWVKWDSGEWAFQSRIAGASVNFPVEGIPTTVDVRIYLPTYPAGAVQYSPFLIFESLGNTV